MKPVTDKEMEAFNRGVKDYETQETEVDDSPYGDGDLGAMWRAGWIHANHEEMKKNTEALK